MILIVKSPSALPFAAALVLVLAGCGQTGPLYMPTPPAKPAAAPIQPVTPVVAPASQAAPAAAQTANPVPVSAPVPVQ
ncbi:lipoprotein [Massilia sp. CMS3.1]|uniref:LPS translocon maturation chaperone LptM n=1 Tax=Massilia sp. CMS3.1 TaxID=3373083 RepID=UPI003EE663FE